MTDEQSNWDKLDDLAIPIARHLIETYREKHGQEELIESLKQVLKSTYDMSSDQEEKGELPNNHQNIENAILTTPCPYQELAEETPALCHAHRELLNELQEENYKLVKCIIEGDDICVFRNSQ